jgi:hypothetical protein
LAWDESPGHPNFCGKNALAFRKRRLRQLKFWSAGEPPSALPNLDDSNPAPSKPNPTPGIVEVPMNISLNH